MLTRHVLCSLGESDCNLQVRMEDEFKTPPRKKKTLLVMTATATLLDFHDLCRTLVRIFWAPPLPPNSMLTDKITFWG